MKISDDLIFGVGMSSFQIEGDGKSRNSLWDQFCKQGNIKDGTTAVNACKFLENYESDIALMKELNVQSYRMSLSWARLFPSPNEINKDAVLKYIEIFEELKKQRIAPIVTLNHWDIPMWFYNLGGFEKKANITYFEQYAKFAFEQYDKYVDGWMTHNEPFCIATLGYLRGIQAPGEQNLQKAMEVSYNLLLSHGKVVQLYKERGYRNKIGIVLNLCPAYSEDGSHILTDSFINSWYLEPLFKSQFCSIAIEQLIKEGCDVSFLNEEELEVISTPIDFFGLNYYGPSYVKYSETRSLGYKDVERKKPKTKEEYQAEPEYLFDLLSRLKAEFLHDIPVYITENGLGESTASIADSIEENGMLSIDTYSNVNDDVRINYLENYISQIQKFNNQYPGTVKAYYLWSFLDNFEWALGYTIKFGIVDVDFETQKRTIKKSGYWYKQLIKEREL